MLEVGYDAETGRLAWLADPTGGRTSFLYSGSGRLSAIQDAAGRPSSVTVDSDNNLRDVQFATGERRSFDYDGHRMTVACNPLGEETLYQYREDGTVQTVTRPGGQSRSFEPAFGESVYVDNKLTRRGSFTDERGVTHTVSVDEAGQLIADDHEVDGLSYQLRQVYAGTLQGATTDENRSNKLLRIGRTRLNGTDLGPSVTWDAMGRPLESENVGDLLWVAEYDDQGYLAAFHPYDTYLRVEWNRDEQGRLVKIADHESSGNREPTGRETLYTWRSDGQPATTTYHGVTTTHSYDPTTGNLTNSTDIAGTLNLGYDAAGNVSLFDDGAQSVAYGYDGSNRLTSITDAEGNVTELGYLDSSCGCSFGDRVTRLHTPDLPPDAQWSYRYDEEGRLATATDPLAHSQSFTYSARGDLQSTTDQLSRSASYTYDSLGRLESTTDSSGRVSTFTYPVPAGGAWAGATLALVSATSVPVESSLTASLPDGAYQVGFNATPAGGNPAQIELYRDATFELSYGRQYDLQGRLQRREDRSAFELSSPTVFPGGSSYDAPFFDEYLQYHRHSALPIPTTVSGPAVRADYTRNSYFEPTKLVGLATVPTPRVAAQDITRDAVGRPTDVETVYYAYDVHLTRNYSVRYLPNGKVQDVEDGAGSRGPYTYDARGLVQDQGSYHYEYDESGRNTTLTYPGGFVRRQTFDELGRLASRCYEFTGYPTRCYTASYDAAGNPVVLGDPEGTSTIQYDDLDRVTEVRRITSTGAEEIETYAYNSLGGLRINNGVVLDDQRPRLDGDGTASAGISAAIGETTITLDGGGRVTAIGDPEFEYNGLGMLAKLDDGFNLYLFGHDALGRMVGFTTLEPDPVYRGAAFFAYEDIFGSSIATQFYEEVAYPDDPEPPPPGTLSDHWKAIYDGIDHPLSGRAQAYAYAPYHYEVDCIGNVRRLRARGSHEKEAQGFEWQAGADFGGYRYPAFGEQYPHDDATPSPAIPGRDWGNGIWQPLRWQGHYVLPSANSNEELYYFRSRIWSPRLGAFLQPDEFGYITRTGTLWSWPGQNPVRWRDPYGEGPRENAIALGAVLGADFGMVLGGGTGIAAGLASGGIGFGRTLGAKTATLALHQPEVVEDACEAVVPAATRVEDVFRRDTDRQPARVHDLEAVGVEVQVDEGGDNSYGHRHTSAKDDRLATRETRNPLELLAIHPLTGGRWSYRQEAPWTPRTRAAHRYFPGEAGTRDAPEDRPVTATGRHASRTAARVSLPQHRSLRKLRFRLARQRKTASSSWSLPSSTPTP